VDHGEEPPLDLAFFLARCGFPALGYTRLLENVGVTTVDELTEKLVDGEGVALLEDRIERPTLETLAGALGVKLATPSQQAPGEGDGGDAGEDATSGESAPSGGNAENGETTPLPSDALDDAELVKRLDRLSATAPKVFDRAAAEVDVEDMPLDTIAPDVLRQFHDRALALLQADIEETE
jgi:hypothetical protein